MTDPRRTGRPPGATGSLREEILSAARELFAANGFRGTTMRAVANQAGVDVALVAHFFKNKDGLFAASLQFPDDAEHEMVHAMATPLNRRAEMITRAYLGLWEAPETREQLRAVARAALGSQALGEKMEGVLANLLGAGGLADASDSSRGAMAVVMAQLLGVAVARHLLQVHTVATLPFEDLVALTAPSIQAALAAESAGDAIG